MWLGRDAGVPEGPAGDLGDSWAGVAPAASPCCSACLDCDRSAHPGGTAEPSIPERMLTCLDFWPPAHPEQDITVPGLREGCGTSCFPRHC